jgi:predicted alpha/beta hydrolase family esterase
MTFQSTILILPGLGSSGPQHWQSIWEREYNFLRVEQQDWNAPVCSDWIETLNHPIKQLDPDNLILVAHSLACTAVAYWAQKYKTAIKGALLVAPSDTEADTFPTVTTGFTPLPLQKLPFKSIVVTSTNDYYVTTGRAELFSEHWGSKFVNIGDVGHINVASGFGEWDEGLQLLKQLDG